MRRHRSYSFWVECLMDSIFTALIPTEDVGKPRGGSAGVVRDRRVVGDDRLLGVEGMSAAAGIVVGTIVFGMVLDDEGRRVDRIRTESYRDMY